MKYVTWFNKNFAKVLILYSTINNALCDEGSLDLYLEKSCDTYTVILE